MAALKRMVAESLRLVAEVCDLIAEGLDPADPRIVGVAAHDAQRGDVVTIHLDGQVIGHG